VTVEGNARSLVISAFQSKDRRPGDVFGLGLLLSQWLGIGRASLLVGTSGEYKITCRSAADAKLVNSWFGGTRTKNVVRGHIVDLTL